MYASMYKKYGEDHFSPMGCRAFLSPWYERGGMEPADEEDRPVFVGRLNIGVVSAASADDSAPRRSRKAGRFL